MTDYIELKNVNKKTNPALTDEVLIADNDASGVGKISTLQKIKDLFWNGASFFDKNTDTADDVTEGTTNRFYPDADRTKLSGIETGADVTDNVNVGVAINAGLEKTTPADTDTLALNEGSVLKKLTWANVKATLKTYFDGVYMLQGTGLGE